MDMIDKGEYYSQIMRLAGTRTIKGLVIRPGVRYMYESHFKGIYNALQSVWPRPIDKEEFIFSMTWVLADLFGDGSEVEVSEHAYDFIRERMDING